jgi:hypothetical protein
LREGRRVSATATSRAAHWRWRLRRMTATRPEVLAAQVEIMLAAEEVDAARKAADELSEIASISTTALVPALASRARGVVHLAEGDAKSAIESLRQSCIEWQALQAPMKRHVRRWLSGWRAGSSVMT